MKNRQQIEQEINEVKELLAKSAPSVLVDEANKTLAEMIEVLNKSEPLCKEGEEDKPVVPPPAVEPEAGETQAHEASESPEQETSEGTQPEEGSLDEKPEGSEEVDELAKEIEGMDDESISQLIQTLQAELAKRSGGATPEGQPQQQPEVPAAPVASEDPALKDQVNSMNQEMEGMKKSLAALQTENEKLKKSVAAASAAPASKPATMNRQVNVLEKSQKAPVQKHFSREEMTSHLEKLQKSGDKRVNSELMLNACYVKTQEQERLFQEICEDMGIKFS